DPIVTQYPGPVTVSGDDPVTDDRSRDVSRLTSTAFATATTTMLASKQHQPLSRRISYAPNSSLSLDFLVHPIGQIASQFDALQENFECVKDVNDALVNFNNAFASFLFGLSVNGACVEWPEAPQIASFERHQITTRSNYVSNYAISAHDLLKQQNTAASNHMMAFDFEGQQQQQQQQQQQWDQEQEEEYNEFEEPRRMIRKFTGKININKVIEKLPLKYREQQGSLVLYQLDPVKYPSALVAV
ncbi:hypothetical protein BC936DRAFT_137779, partial [Jimgerdemannia flammicorona]